MKLLIAIPSKNRIDILASNALKWVPYSGVDWKVFVEPQDLMQYQRYISESNIIVLPENNKGLGYSKQIIKEYAKAGGYTHIFKIDDDVRGFTKWRQRLSDEAMTTWFREIMFDVEKAFDIYSQVRAVSFPYGFEMYEKKKWEVTKRIQTAYIVATESLYVDPAISVFEDFATGLHIMAKGGLILKYGMAGINMGVKVGGGTGGHQSYDRCLQAINEVEPLRKIYPALNFRKVDKPWKIEPDLSSVKLAKRDFVSRGK